MADTLSLDTTVGYVMARGGSVRLIGDDQQLTAVGAGGVLRDIAATHGAVHLRELMRFADPAEAAASLALRDGRPEALGFYLDQHRVHVGDLTTITDETFTAWLTDRGRGLDAVMLAPTRDLVADLNHRARTHRLTGTRADADPGAEVVLADGNRASSGDLVITRQNLRAVRVTASDWVKNGDRWTVLAVHDDASLTVRHLGHGHRVRLPAGYVAESVELGYATTVHAAQGISADTMHGVACGGESRQQLYTMLTRGRHANHVYLQTAGDGDPHTVIHPDLVHPATPTEVLEQILARDDTPRSASTRLRDQDDPAHQLGAATARYVDALAVAAADVAGPAVVAGLDRAANRVVAGLADAPAWPALRAHLLLLAAAGTDPVAALQAAAAVGEVDTARDAAAVLDWRLDSSGLRGAGPGSAALDPRRPTGVGGPSPLGCLPDRTVRPGRRPRRAGVRRRGRGHHHAGVGAARDRTAGTGRGRRCRGVAGRDRRRSRGSASDRSPPAGRGRRHLAARPGPAPRRRPRLLRGPGRVGTPPARGGARHPPRPVHAGPGRPPRRPRPGRPGRPRDPGRRRGANHGPLPDDHAAAALWWRITRRLSPTVLADLDHDPTPATAWTRRLADVLGPDRAAAVQASPWWPALVAAVEDGLRRGWRLEDLLTEPTGITAADIDDGQALTWRASILTSPAPADDHRRWASWPTTPHPTTCRTTCPYPHRTPPTSTHHPSSRDTRPPVPGLAPSATTAGAGSDSDDGDVDGVPVEVELAAAAAARGLAGPPEPSDAAIERMVTRAIDAEQSPVSPERIAELNEAAACFYQEAFTDSWGRDYLLDRFGVDLHRHPLYRPGQAPAGWTRLTDHLRGRGASDAELLAAGLAVTARTGRLIDRFRDRVLFPILGTDAHRARLHRPPPARPRRHHRAEVPQHRRHRPLPQGRPPVRRSPAARQHGGPGARRRPDGRDRRHPRRRAAATTASPRSAPP